MSVDIFLTGVTMTHTTINLSNVNAAGILRVLGYFGSCGEIPVSDHATVRAIIDLVLAQPKVRKEILSGYEDHYIISRFTHLKELFAAAEEHNVSVTYG